MHLTMAHTLHAAFPPFGERFKSADDSNAFEPASQSLGNISCESRFCSG
jgi:hypothetical protein